MLIPFAEIARRFPDSVTGIIHGGAHLCEEKVAYNNNGVSDQSIVWIDANSDLVEICKQRHHDIQIINVALSDTSGKEVKFKITNNTEASSLLDLGTHKTRYPQIHVEKEITVTTKRIDDVLEDANIDPSKYNFINLDLQGMELPAVKGIGNNIKYIDFAYLEVSFEDLYRGCARMNEMDSYLNENGFIRINLVDTGYGWGDAMYVKKKFLDNHINVLRRTERYQLIFNILNDMSKIYNFMDDEWSKYKIQFDYVKYMLGQYDLISTSFNTNKLMKRIINWAHVRDHRPEINGEFVFFDGIKFDINILFDVGARDDIYYVKKSSELIVHAFEPNPINYQKLLHNIEVNGIGDRIKPVHVGLGNKNTTVEYYSDTESIFKRTNHITSAVIPYEITIEKLSHYCSMHNIESIDFLKIDTEGYELDVLLGCEEMITSIRIIQFEYGGTYLDSKITLKQIFDLLGPDRYYYLLQGNGLHQIKYDDIRPYDDYSYANFIASTTSMFELINLNEVSTL